MWFDLSKKGHQMHYKLRKCLHIRKHRNLCVIALFVIVLVPNLISLNTILFIIHSVFAYWARWIGLPTSFTVNQDKTKGVLMYNKHEYHYLINNPDKCIVEEPFLLIFVKTHPHHYQQRQAIRETWGDVSTWNNENQHKLIVMFLVGVTKSKTKSFDLEEEGIVHGDIIQTNVVEHFHNLTLKLVEQFKWTVTFCSQAKYFVTTDDDVFIHVKNLISYLLALRHKYVYAGFVHVGSAPYRDPENKYFVSSDIYSGLYFPDYCPGAGYVLSINTVKLLYNLVPMVPVLYIDDVYTGLLANIANVKPVHFPWFFGEYRVPSDTCFLHHFITSHAYSPTQLREMSLTLHQLERTSFLCPLKVFLHQLFH